MTGWVSVRNIGTLWMNMGMSDANVITTAVEKLATADTKIRMASWSLRFIRFVSDWIGHSTVWLQWRARLAVVLSLRFEL